MRKTVAILFLVLAWGTIGGATADDYPAVTKATNAYSVCVGKAAIDQAQTDKTPEAGADAALTACSAESKAVMDALTSPPANMTLGDAIATMKAMQDKGRNIAIGMIKERRG